MRSLPNTDTYPETTSAIRETDGHALRISDHVLDELVWQMTHPASIVTMSKATLRALLEAYSRDVLRQDREIP